MKINKALPATPLRLDFTPAGPYAFSYVRFSLPSDTIGLNVGSGSIDTVPPALLLSKAVSDMLSEYRNSGVLPSDGGDLVTGQNFGSSAVLAVLSVEEYQQLCHVSLREVSKASVPFRPESVMMTLPALEEALIGYVVLDGNIVNQAHLIMMARYCLFDESWEEAVSETLADCAASGTPDIAERPNERSAMSFNAADYPYCAVTTVRNQADYRMENLKQQPDWRDDCDCEVCTARRVMFGATTRDALMEQYLEAVHERSDRYHRDALMMDAADVLTVKPTSAVTLRA